MIKRISIIILSILIVAAGVVSSRKVRMWDRSVMIFNYKSQGQIAGRGMRRPGTGFEERRDVRPGGRGQIIPGEGRDYQMRRPPSGEGTDSLPNRFDRGRYGQFPRGQFPDSIRNRARSGEFGRNLDPGFRGSERNFQGDQGRDIMRGRGGFYRGRKVYLRTVLWYLGVLALFTALSIYADKAWYFTKKKLKKRHFPG